MKRDGTVNLMRLDIRASVNDEARPRTLPISRRRLSARPSASDPMVRDQKLLRGWRGAWPLHSSPSGGEVRVAVATSDQVAPEGCTLRLRSLGDRT